MWPIILIKFIPDTNRHLTTLPYSFFKEKENMLINEC